jgi:hypothetical protein
MKKAYDNEEEPFAPSAENPDGPRYAMHREEKNLDKPIHIQEKELPLYSVDYLVSLSESELEKLTSTFQN